MPKRPAGHLQAQPNGARSIGVLILWAALLATVFSCAQPPQSGERYHIGQTVDVDGWQVTVHSFVALASAEDRQPAPGSEFRAVEVTLTNASNGIRFFMPERQMTLTDANGTRYELDHNASVMAARTHQWTVQDGEISVGETAHGAASYEVPAGAQGLLWVFRSSLLPGAQTVVFLLGDSPPPLPRDGVPD